MTIMRFQNPKEFSWLLDVVARELGWPERFLEIGTHDGGTAVVWHAISCEPSRRPPPLILCVDIHDITGGKLEQYSGVELIVGDSREPATVAKVAARLGGQPVDLLHIDGDHSYEACRDDFNNYYPFLRTGGLCVFHDLFSRPDSRDSIDVARFVREVVDRQGFESVWMYAASSTGGIAVGKKG